MPQPTGSAPSTPGSTPGRPGPTTRGRPAPIADLPEFTIEWKDVRRVSPVTVSGVTEAEARQAARAKKPMLVYVFGSDRESGRDPRFMVEDHRVFQDETVAVGTRFYTCLRIHELDAKKDRALKKYASRAPCLVLLRPDYRGVKCLQMKWKAQRVYLAMDVTLGKDFTNCIHCALKARKTMQQEDAAIAQGRAEQAELDQRLAREKSAQARASIQKKRDALAGRLAKAEQDLGRRKKELFELQPKQT
ncbi:MAG: hypothetical protein ACYTG3_13130 [Planctomycetota bacterium]|jgi:hypothetical protein